MHAIRRIIDDPTRETEQNLNLGTISDMTCLPGTRYGTIPG
jgi:hypothetical protein